MICAENISLSIGANKLLLNNVSITARPGELLAVLGPNGAGKSTLLKILSGAIKPTQGHVSFQDRLIDAISKPELALQRAVLAQQYSMAANFLVKDVVMMGRYPHFNGRPLSTDHEIVEESLKTVGISSLTERNINTLSGGEQQRVHLARVLAQVSYSNPAKKGLLLLDEPVSSLDIQYQHVVLDIAKNKSQQGHTVICVLHDLNLAAQYADRIVILKEGTKYVDDIPTLALDAKQLEEIYNIPFKVINENGQLLVLPGRKKQVKQNQTEKKEVINV